MREEWITSRKNPLLVQIRRLASSRGARRSAGMFLGDGVKLLEEALRWKAPLTTVVVPEGAALPDTLRGYLSQLPAGVNRILRLILLQR